METVVAEDKVFSSLATGAEAVVEVGTAAVRM